MIVEGGATIESRTLWRLGSGDNSHGSLTVRGAGSSVTTGQINLGAIQFPVTGGTGSLLVENGGHLHSQSFHSLIGFGADTTGSATVRGDGSKWLLERDGQYGRVRVLSGSLLIEDGGTVIGAGGDVGAIPGRTAVAIVRGAGSTWINHDYLVVGEDSWQVGARGRVDVESAGRIDVGQTLNVSRQGTLAVTTGGAVSVGSLPPEQDLHELEGDRVHVWEDGRVVGRGDIDVAELRSVGRVQPGSFGADDPPGTLSLAGHYQQQASGTLEIAITDDTHSQLAVDGEAVLAGTLEVAWAGEDEAELLGQAVIVLTASAILGRFDDVRAAGRDDLYFDVAYASQAVTVTSGLIGDMNGDGVVDTGDVAPFVLALTDPAAYEAQYGIDPALVGDINQDGSFDTGDVAAFVQLLVNSDSAIPEPGSLALLGLGGLMVLRRQRAP